MDKKYLKYLLAPFGVATGVGVFIAVSTYLTSLAGIPGNLTSLFSFIPRIIFIIIGLILIIFWFPFFISGIYFLGRRGAVGQSDKLIIEGIYKYVRNPMCSGLSFTIIGIGLLLNLTGVLLAGILWLTIAFIQCKREERELTQRFGDDYLKYKSLTPMFIPKITIFNVLFRRITQDD